MDVLYGNQIGQSKGIEKCFQKKILKYPTEKTSPPMQKLRSTLSPAPAPTNSHLTESQPQLESGTKVLTLLAGT